MNLWWNFSIKSGSTTWVGWRWVCLFPGKKKENNNKWVCLLSISEDADTVRIAVDKLKMLFSFEFLFLLQSKRVTCMCDMSCPIQGHTVNTWGNPLILLCWRLDIYSYYSTKAPITSTILIFFFHYNNGKKWILFVIRTTINISNPLMRSEELRRTCKIENRWRSAVGSRVNFNA